MRYLITTAMLLWAGGAWAEDPKPLIACPQTADGIFHCLDPGASMTQVTVPPHRYTLDEIDRMRAAVAKKMVAQAQQDCDAYVKKYSGPGTLIAACPNDVSLQSVELNVQTYMAAGITPEELEAREKK